MGLEKRILWRGFQFIFFHKKLKRPKYFLHELFVNNHTYHQEIYYYAFWSKANTSKLALILLYIQQLYTAKLRTINFININALKYHSKTKYNINCAFIFLKFTILNSLFQNCFVYFSGISYLCLNVAIWMYIWRIRRVFQFKV